MENNKRPETMERITTKALADAFIAEQVKDIQTQVGDKKVLLALSGGVDSSVVAALLIKAIGKQLVCVHVNHGLLRKGEPEQVIEVFRNQMDANLVYVDAVDRFLSKLSGGADPEKKRKIIGELFVRVFEEEARKQEGIEFLAQGTIYPDILESDGVKAHHNVGGLPEDLQFALVEPLKFLYKDEVRVVGKALGLPEATGALIGSVMPDEPAAKGGMKDGDVVLEVNGQKIDDSSALLRAIATEAPGSKVNMVVWRDGERKNITVQLGERNLKASSGKSGSAVEQDAPSIGLSVRPLTKEEARTANVKPGTGLLIVGVEPGKLAAEAELREGDIILSANLKPIKSVEEFSKIIREDAKKRGVVMLQLQRQGQTFFRSLALSDTPDGAKK